MRRQRLFIGAVVAGLGLLIYVLLASQPGGIWGPPRAQPTRIAVLVTPTPVRMMVQLQNPPSGSGYGAPVQSVEIVHFADGTERWCFRGERRLVCYYVAPWGAQDGRAIRGVVESEWDYGRASPQETPTPRPTPAPVPPGMG